jgi:hypothetical protein
VRVSNPLLPVSLSIAPAFGPLFLSAWVSSNAGRRGVGAYVSAGPGSLMTAAFDGNLRRLKGTLRAAVNFPGSVRSFSRSHSYREFRQAALLHPAIDCLRHQEIYRFYLLRCYGSLKSSLFFF